MADHGDRKWSFDDFIALGIVMVFCAVVGFGIGGVGTMLEAPPWMRYVGVVVFLLWMFRWLQKRAAMDTSAYDKLTEEQKQWLREKLEAVSKN